MPPARPAWVESTLHQVDEAFVETGAETPGWPDPHPDMASPAEDEYSRCLDPAKYRILDTRLDAWARVFGDRGVATTEDLPGFPDVRVGGVRATDQYVRARRMTPTRPGAMSVLLGHTLVDGAPFGIDVGVICSAETDLPVAMIGTLPVCGCDACDDGSERLLEELDGAVITVASGGVVHARRGNNSVTRQLDGYTGVGDTPGSWLDPTALVGDSVQRWSGDPWL